MVVSQVVGQVVVKVRQGVRRATDWWRPWFVGEKGGRQIKQDSSRRFRDPWVTQIGVASIINLTRPLLE